MNHKSIIALWPNPPALARDLGVEPDNVYKWEKRNRIPAERWLDIVEAANSRGYDVSLTKLADAARNAMA